MLAVITERLDDACAAWLAERCDVARHAYDAPGFLNAIAHADALIVRTYTIVNDALLDAATNLRVIARAGVGLDNIDLAACAARNIAVVHTPDANTQAVVEYVLALMLDHYRPRVTLTPTNAPDFHSLRATHTGTQLDTLTLALLGFGRIGKRLGAAAHTLGLRVLAHDLLPPDDLRAAVDFPVELVDFHTLLDEADVLSVHTDGRPANRHLLNADALARLKPDALLINAARGMLLDHAALNDWLTTHPHAHAILDVHDPEPPPATLPLFDRPNCRLLPHLASRTDVALANMSWVVRDAWAVLQGQPPRHPAPAP